MNELMPRATLHEIVAHRNEAIRLYITNVPRF
jgi:hypothetical protein